MKRFTISLMVLPFLFAACTSDSEILVSGEIMVEEVRTCSNVVKVELFMRSSVSGFARVPMENIVVKLTLENGKYIYHESWNYSEWNKGGLLKTVTKMEIGKEYCFTDYKPIK